MRLHLETFSLLSLVLLQTSRLTLAGSGYHYDRPGQSISSVTHAQTNTGGHHFGPLSTVSPLPPVPALPPLPTGRPSTQVHTQSILQLHPPPSASRSIANAYRPPSGAVPQLQHSYLPPVQSPQTTYQRQTQPTVNAAAGGYAPTITLRAGEPVPVPQAGYFGQRIQSPGSPYAPATPNFPSTLTQAPVQPLRIPFGKQAVVHLPSTQPAVGEVYNVGDRQLKQYAVIEIIDNDIEQNTQPFLTTPFIDTYRAQIGASGTGAAPPPTAGQQIGSQANALVLAQQNLALRGGANNNDAIALGSGGLGFVRLPNGNVYLGSGSLGYISGKQHSALVQEARTRKGSPTPDALHFGHGALGNPDNGRRFRF